MSATSRVPDPRLDKLAAIAGSAQIIPTRLTFVDIAGLVRGASKGEGLGNQFLANIREVDAIAHVVRCFEDGDITHVEGKIDPIADTETIETELMLADLDSLEKRVVNLEKKAKGGDKEAKEQLDLDATARWCCCARASRRASSSASRRKRSAFSRLGLLTSKPVLYVCNVEEALGRQGQRLLGAASSSAPRRRARSPSSSPPRSRAEIADAAARRAARSSLEAVGLEEPGLDRLIRAGYELLGPRHLFHRRPEGSARLDHHQGHQGARRRPA